MRKQKESPLLQVVINDAVIKSQATGKVACLFEIFSLTGEFMGLNLRAIVPSEDKRKINRNGKVFEHGGIIGETLPSNKFILIITPTQLRDVVTKTLYNVYVCLSR